MYCTGTQAGRIAGQVLASVYYGTGNETGWWRRQDFDTLAS